MTHDTKPLPDWQSAVSRAPESVRVAAQSRVHMEDMPTRPAVVKGDWKPLRLPATLEPPPPVRSHPVIGRRLLFLSVALAQLGALSPLVTVTLPRAPRPPPPPARPNRQQRRAAAAYARKGGGR